MPKRKHEEDSEQRYLRKLKKYEEKLLSKRNKRQSRVIYSSDEDIAEIEEHYNNEEISADVHNMADVDNNDLTDHIFEGESIPTINLSEEDTQKEGQDEPIRPSLLLDFRIRLVLPLPVTKLNSSFYDYFNH
ncbi:hypothetical protein JYU34_009940 [Plutella xylostella]|uniref:Uncharacterized protein n=1 Tax=Plutella xylostella TaxID=51655 RepID=A0ABQ7QKT7_PLUXY|nr:hypothetical protein JYU34_009940 [Plutella xylostella]